MQLKSIFYINHGSHDYFYVKGVACSDESRDSAVPFNLRECFSVFQLIPALTLLLRFAIFALFLAGS